MIGRHVGYAVGYHLYGVGGVGGNGLMAHNIGAINLKAEVTDRLVGGIDHRDIRVVVERAFISALSTVGNVSFVAFANGLTHVEYLFPVLTHKYDDTQIVHIIDGEVANLLRHNIGILFSEERPGRNIVNGVTPLASE